MSRVLNGTPGADHGTAWLIATKPPFAWLPSRATPAAVDQHHPVILEQVVGGGDPDHAGAQHDHFMASAGLSGGLIGPATIRISRYSAARISGKLMT